MKENEKEKLAFCEQDRQQLIDYYKEHPMLWNSQLKDYRNRDLRRVNLDRLASQPDSCYSVEKIQQEWHNLATYFDRERMRMEGSKKSDAGSDEVYQTSWPYYTSMEFCLDKSNPDDTVSTLNHIPPVTMKRRKKNYGKYLVNACQQTPQILIATPGKWHGSKDSKLDFNKLGNNVPKCLCNSKCNPAVILRERDQPTRLIDVLNADALQSTCV